MKVLLHARFPYIAIAVVLVACALFLLVRVLTVEPEALLTATVERGDVIEVVSVSGVVEAENTAELVFPTTGVVAEVLVAEGDVVATGDTLARLESASLQADRTDAIAALTSARADRDELISGVRDETRAITTATVANAEDNLVRVTREEEEKVANARRALYSGDLAAYAERDTNSVAPIISGTYICTETGAYELDPFNSSAASGYSYRFTGLEIGTASAFTDQSAPLGECGLRIQFDANSNYGVGNWTIPVPNPSGSSYATNVNTYELAKEQAANKIEAAAEALELTRKEQTLENADPREEALARANAAVLQAEARLARVDALLADRVLTAPFSGTITNVDTIAGESVSTAPIITLLAADAFELTARIPEIDITKVALGQSTQVIFDARPEEVISGEITFISPLATEIDGVAYFTAHIGFTDSPAWLRSGLNADIEILVASVTNTLRLPQRFVVTTDDTSVVTQQRGEALTETTVDVQFAGNDGFVAITGLEEGDVVVAP